MNGLAKPIVVLEAFNIGPGGSEQGTGLAWLLQIRDAQPDVTVHVVCGPSGDVRVVQGAGAVCHQVAIPLVLRLVRGILRPLLRKVPRLEVAWQRVEYLGWLPRAARQAGKLAKGPHPTLALHVSWTSLLLGSRLGRLRGPRRLVVICGNFPVPAPEGFFPYMSWRERLFYRLRAPLLRWTRRHRGADVVVVNSQSIADELKASGERAEFVVCKDPLNPASISSCGGSKRHALFVDSLQFERKGRRVLQAALKRCADSDLGLAVQIVTPRPEEWQANRNVQIVPWLTETQFQDFLGGVAFVLSASWREGRPTSVMRACAMGAIPIVPDSLIFEDFPPECALKYDCDADAAAALAGALSTAARLGPDERSVMSTAARQWAGGELRASTIARLIAPWLGRLS